MFTGLVEGKGRILELIPKGKGFEITIESSFSLQDSKIGDSISVDGVCLTVVYLREKIFKAHLSPETISRTTFKVKKSGDFVNLERALKFGDRLGGHLVTGHVDGVGTLKKIQKQGDYFLFEVAIHHELSRYAVPKGSIAIDGISLTINEIFEDTLHLMIIPHTFEVTTLGLRKVGDLVNVEMDIIAKMVYQFTKPYASQGTTQEKKDKPGTITLDFLNEHGFL